MSTERFGPNPMPCGYTRRSFLWELGGGFAGMALTNLLSGDNFFADAKGNAPSDLRIPVPARAKYCIFLFMNGAPSQVDTFDPKPALTRFEGTEYKGKIKVGSNGRPVGFLTQTPFGFKKYGQSGLEISSLFPHVARHADDLCVIRSMVSDTAAHGSATLQMNTGSPLIGRPSLGSWLNYGLGSANENLPSFVVMTDTRGGPISGAPNWSAGYMPAAHQGTLFRAKGVPLLDLATPEGVADRTQRRSLDLLKTLNQTHLAARKNESELAARIKSYELAYKMQVTAAETVDLERESPQLRRMYGLENSLTADFGRKCLIARRLVERGVRFVQLYSGGGHIEDTWDGHQDCVTNHRKHAGETDQPIGALIADLKQRGLWDETLIIWGGEFGRTPTAEGKGKPGRDHNWKGFSMWLAGGAVKGGQAIGATDELGFEAIEDRCHVSDLHANILHLMGLDHENLSYFYNGLDQRLSGPEPRRIFQQIVA
jgi:hypothetical protein